MEFLIIGLVVIYLKFKLMDLEKQVKKFESEIKEFKIEIEELKVRNKNFRLEIKELRIRNKRLENRNERLSDEINKKVELSENNIIPIEKIEAKETVESAPEKDFYTDIAIYEGDSEKAIKMFIDELYERKYKTPEKKGEDFERFIGAVYDLAGYEVELNGISSKKEKKPDGGKDVIVEKNGKKQ